MKMSISKFYENREVFLTGVTGSLGKVLLEKLLRSCNTRKIYILIRSKKGMPAEERKTELFRSKIFENVLLTNPDIYNKVECIEGNLTRENLGISFSNMNLITKNVSVVFHLAASVKFNEPFRDAFVNNVETTKNVVEVCRQMKNLLVLIYTSTAFSFFNKEKVDEKIYTMYRTYKEFNNIANLENNASVEITDESLLENRPNTYTLTKAITENYLNEFCRDLPIVIVRPSIVGSTWKEPFAGWNDMNSAADYVVATGLKGILRSMLCDKGKISDFIPSDAVINLMLSAAWRKSITPHRREDEILVYNCTSGSINPFTWQQFFKCVSTHYWKYPPENTFLYPTNIPKKNYYWNQVCLVMQHRLPAMLADVFRVAIGKKPKMMTVYNKLHKTMKIIEPFTTREWTFPAGNVGELLKMMSTQDKQNFDFDISKLNWDQYMKHYFLGIRRFVLKEDDSTIPRCRKIILTKYYSILLAKTGLLFGFLYILTFLLF
ncbi:putative fatty acyl-CoA reductase CG5065 [Centruroides vittatus]|uniref:putative fatty acyl-CoA reductase CG5065 n=1 Tax=Centruroides vittatus TaxID=120091 RepID=UPI00350F688F